MKNRNFVTIFLLLITIIAFGFGCASAQPDSKNAQPKATVSKTTKITKEILKTNLTGKNVQFVEKLSDNEKPNPLFLSIKVVGSGADGKSPLMATLNSEAKQGVSELVTQLRSIFKMRADQGVFLEGKNEVDKRVNIPASEADIAFYNKENIYVEDLEKLIDALHKAEIDQISVNFVDNTEREITIDDLNPVRPPKIRKP
ncbi:MAG TPA: hypothetical protein PLP07_09520 [Pyrinomonadaceae bacterium]|nr:hypothetical protein [Chloracidobacterium sp.]MBP9108062.1 hypothetical protein [Pyrinomonadaceae bacterium]MBK7802012.1 hypothetical protein [Chloracidobacterium sp.]MBK9765740.1 hypothetical protein [Chloracidobacterium sp.]MBL0242317.1 hypothetical protein [Chloracidobacterium sp.]